MLSIILFVADESEPQKLIPILAILISLIAAFTSVFAVIYQAKKYKSDRKKDMETEQNKNASKIFVREQIAKIDITIVNNKNESDLKFNNLESIFKDSIITNQKEHDRIFKSVHLMFEQILNKLT